MEPVLDRFSSFQDIIDLHLKHWISFDSLHYVLNTIIAAALGGLIGINHKNSRIAVGARTFSAVAIGTSLASGCVLHINHIYHVGGFASAVAGILSGMGFIAGAVILQTQSEGVFGLTSAATIWATAVVGLAVGLEFYAIATFASLLLTGFLWITRHVDE